LRKRHQFHELSGSQSDATVAITVIRLAGWNAETSSRQRESPLI